MSISLRFAEPSDAEALHSVIREAFAARPPVDPPAAALSDTVESVRDAIEAGYGILLERDGAPIAGLLVAADGDTAKLCRVSVVPGAAGSGVGFQMVSATLTALADLGFRQVEAAARHEFPHNIAWWERAGFEQCRPTENGVVLACALPVAVQVPDADAMRRFGQKLAQVLRAGDVIVATGELGAGKTTLTQGIGEGLDVDGPVISPTFVLSRIHPSRGSGPGLVHVDAYRLSSAEELADIDLQSTLATSVTLVEWGAGLAEWLSDEPLAIDIQRSDDPADDQRTVYLAGIGQRWADVLDQFREFA
uniref:tRNA (adenosine(37)-N6)-threonylcarbamoyltransferase complex ATPase subunit type 1 TsaE n=1 Tax=Tessaracoccus timonensis TaxID=2161816 RepID=UPI001E2BE397|nr:tRNA (adenosine(37)-N6)-threonylcarbamoyltransferase complex ATPase subunit type 1 TsaE [Tessaracoccus timonensis]